jgi:NitT/TauT family transport system ATP-binding protein
VSAIDVTANGAELGSLSLRGISKHYRSRGSTVEAVREASFEISSGEVVSLLGPSGCGKSTILKIVAGLLPYEGEVQVDGQPLNGPHSDVGVMFQSPVLFPWKSVKNNVLLPARMRGRATPEHRKRADYLLDLVGIDEFAEALPAQLSGGMQQRAALARTLLMDPRILLLDEPFGALDELTRERLNLELLTLHEQLNKTILMITHSITESVFMSDRVLVMSSRPGRIVGEVTVNLPRPRTTAMMKSDEFAEVAYELRTHLGLEKSE